MSLSVAETSEVPVSSDTANSYFLYNTTHAAFYNYAKINFIATFNEQREYCHSQKQGSKENDKY